MREYKQVEVTRLSKVTCDICGAENLSEDWGTGYGTDKITVIRECGKTYPDDVEIEVTEYDLCPGCFEKLEEWMNEMGATPRIRVIHGRD